MRSKKYDIVVADNKIGGRQGWAYICNSNNFPVLDAPNGDKKSDETYCSYGPVRVRTPKGITVGNLEWIQEDGGERWMIGNSGCFISNSFGLSDAVELIQNANAPIIEESLIVAVAIRNSVMAMLKLYKVGHIDRYCTRMCSLIPLTEEEMENILHQAEKWCDR